ncbi:hypothetical protein ACROYT_G014878 [Oculina patagonica]
MCRKPCFSRPWVILITWNFPKEVFVCLKVAISSEENGGYVAKTTCYIEQNHMVSINRLQNVFFALTNKYTKLLDERSILVKEVLTSRVIVDKEHHAVCKYSKITEMLRISVRCLGGQQSYAARQRERLDSSFEGKHAAMKRKETTSELDETPVVKRKRHAGNFEAMTWDKDGLKNEMEGYGDETKVNWSEIARRYQIKNKKGQIAKNGGQIAQEWLISQGVNLHRFNRPSENERQPRRKKLKGLGGEISLPTPETNDSLKQKLKLKIQQGEFTVGELIVPREYEKLIIDADGKIHTTTFTVQGRKQPLEEIRRKTLEVHEKFMKVKPDEYYSEMSREDVITQLTRLNEYNPDDGLTKMRKKLQKISTTRHLQIWHDHSTLANTGHIIFTVNCLYDPAIYMTDDEYKAASGKVLNIQTEVEKPHVYIVARCRSCDVEQLAYVETRLCCLQHLQRNLKTKDGVEIKDIMRFFHGDSPSREFESGQ